MTLNNLSFQKFSPLLSTTLKFATTVNSLDCIMSFLSSSNPLQPLSTAIALKNCHLHVQTAAFLKRALQRDLHTGKMLYSVTVPLAKNSNTPRLNRSFIQIHMILLIMHKEALFLLVKFLALETLFVHLLALAFQLPYAQFHLLVQRR